jgi:hypothetical protein
MASWKAIRSHWPTKDPDIQVNIELDFRKEWLHMNILGTDHATIRWHVLPPYISFLLLMSDGAVASLPAWGSSLRLAAAASDGLSTSWMRIRTTFVFLVRFQHSLVFS